MLLSWENSKEWISFVARIRRDVLGDRGQDRISQHLLVNEVEKAICAHYEGFIGYHGCRPVDVGAYYNNGLLRHSDTTLAECRALALELSGVSSDAVDFAISKINRQIDLQKAYVVLDGRCLIEKSPHYLIYGSEFTMCIFARLAEMGYPNYQYKLKTRGFPSLLTCHIPFKLLKEQHLREIAETLVRYACDLRYRSSRNVPSLDHTVVLHVDLPPSFIVSHTHPNDLVDWHDGGRRYHW